jgi:hypothetical protein
MPAAGSRETTCKRIITCNNSHGHSSIQTKGKQSLLPDSSSTSCKLVTGITDPCEAAESWQ